MFYVRIFQLFLTFVSYNYTFVAKKSSHKSSCLNQLYYFWAIENILEFTCVTYMLHMYEYVYVTCVTYVMDNFIPNSVFIGFICLTFLHCAFSNVSSNCLHEKGKVTFVALVWLFSTVRFQMSPQISCNRRDIVALVAFVWLFSTVCFQMWPQWTWIRACIVTLVAFVWFFSTVRFYMSPQMACLRGCIVALVAFIRLFSTVCFQMFPQIPFLVRGKIALVAFVWLFSTMCF